MKFDLLGWKIHFLTSMQNFCWNTEITDVHATQSLDLVSQRNRHKNCGKWPLRQVIDLFVIHSNTNESEKEYVARKAALLLFSVLVCKYESGIM